MNYEELLKRARENLPKSLLNKERFEIMKVTGRVEGSKTIITNFNQICSSFSREPDHLLKYLQRELATPAFIDGPRLILKRKLASELINSKIQQYAEEFVLCSECGKPDTKLTREDGKALYIKCMACGAKHPIKANIS